MAKEAPQHADPFAGFPRYVPDSFENVLDKNSLIDTVVLFLEAKEDVTTKTGKATALLCRTTDGQEGWIFTAPDSALGKQVTEGLARYNAFVGKITTHAQSNGMSPYFMLGEVD